MSDPTIEDQITCVKREIRLRENAYAKWVATKRMTQQTADKELGCMRAVLSTLEREKQRLRPALFR